LRDYNARELSANLTITHHLWVNTYIAKNESFDFQNSVVRSFCGQQLLAAKLFVSMFRRQSWKHFSKSIHMYTFTVNIQRIPMIDAKATLLKQYEKTAVLMSVRFIQL